MNSRTVAFAVLVCLLFVGSSARSETLDDLVKEEEGVEFGRCALTPRPTLGGDSIHAVIPARFENPGIWSTRWLLLVAVDAQMNVQGTLELRLHDDVPPREVVSVSCAGKRVTIKLSSKVWNRVLSYTWDGQALRKGTKRRKS